jgi:hypothetical protein
MATEKRLIDANVVPKLFEKKYEETEQRILDGETYLDTLAEGFTEADDVILSMATVDAVEVIRCKECRWYNLELGICNLHSESKGDPNVGYAVGMDPDDFCSYGERRTDT